MKVLMLSADENLFKDGSEVLSRIVDYGKLVEELHIVIKSSQKVSKVIGNVFLYSTNSFGLFYFPKALSISKKIIKENNGWLVTTQDPFELGLVGYFLKLFKSVPLQIQIHTDFLSPYFKDESIRNRIRVFLGKRIVSKADGIRVVSERIKKSLVANGYTLNPIRVLPIFIDISKIKKAPINIDLRQKYPDRFIILMASRLTKEKNIGLAIKAIKNLVPNYPNILLLIVGSGPELENLKSQISNLKLQDSVVIENWSDDLPSYYKTADLFLLVSNYEGYGLTVIEATAAGLPVLMTNVGVAVGRVIPVDDKTALVDGLNKLISSRAERENVLENQKNVLDFYTSKEDYLNQLKQSWENCFS